MSTTVGKKSANEAVGLMATERNGLALIKTEEQFEPEYIVEGETVILFRNTTWAGGN